MQINAKIKRITRKEIQTKYGKRQKYGLLIIGKNNKDVWINAWDHALVRKLKEGDQLVGEVEKGEYNGNPQYTFRPPKIEEIILEKLERIEAKLNGSLPTALPNIKYATKANEDLPPPIDEDMPEEIDESDIVPF